MSDSMTHDTLYIGCNGSVVAVRTSDGAELWRTSLPPGSSTFLSPTIQQDVCLLHHDGRVFAGCYGHLYCLDGVSGQVLWHNELRGLGHNDVTLALGYQSVQFVSTQSRK